MSHIEKNYREQLAEAEEELKFFNESLEFLKTDEKIQEFLSKYNPASIDSFMNSYALHRYRWKKHGESFYQLSLTKKYKHWDKAIDLFREIYYKKSSICFANGLQAR
ncbi:MAG: hypothetical protein NTX03_07695 [Bacteroidetes bacterium]|nr:hypothetical protein [Bacteroidota bacterium]